MRNRFGIELPLKTIFEQPTVRGQADWLARQRREDTLTPLLRHHPDAPKLLSHAQQRLWFLAQLEGPSATYNMPAALALTGVLDQAALSTSLQALVARQQSLRLIFPAVDGEATLSELAVYDPLEIVDLRGIDEPARQSRIETEVQAHASAPSIWPAAPCSGPDCWCSMPSTGYCC